MRLLLLLPAAALLLPQAARAECTGPGCYDDLLTALILLAIGAVAVLALVVWLLWRLVGRIRADNRGKRGP